MVAVHYSPHIDGDRDGRESIPLTTLSARTMNFCGQVLALNLSRAERKHATGAEQKCTTWGNCSA